MSSCIKFDFLKINFRPYIFGNCVSIKLFQHWLNNEYIRKTIVGKNHNRGCYTCRKHYKYIACKYSNSPLCKQW